MGLKGNFPGLIGNKKFNDKGERMAKESEKNPMEGKHGKGEVVDIAKHMGRSGANLEQTGNPAINPDAEPKPKASKGMPDAKKMKSKAYDQSEC